MNRGHVEAVHLAAEHEFSKATRDSIEIVAGIGVRGDAHAGEKVQHLSRVRVDPSQPNFRQVHLIPCELFDELRERGFALLPGQLGENISTRGIDLLRLGRDDKLRIGDVVLRVTGLRNPCAQIEAFKPGLLKHLVFQEKGQVVRKAGIMTTAVTGGIVRAGDTILLERASGERIPLDRV
ncbi:MOSC domain-containing protein [Qipengyuania sp. XHP0207]|uniref:MOSC domain-containing protein n=1 Tax=Qipengyuania sp. XHP0207 TaxID=3038078 RepID=UPI00241F3DF5|nr:MOSC domain-containing protein [Qipengyuania sp. XHP0207]MDG5748651.1 MOSC domain-containing protein [Qipengyuania sp. XHP0207]